MLCFWIFMIFLYEVNNQIFIGYNKLLLQNLIPSNAFCLFHLTPYLVGRFLVNLITPGTLHAVLGSRFHLANFPGRSQPSEITLQMQFTHKELLHVEQILTGLSHSLQIQGNNLQIVQSCLQSGFCLILINVSFIHRERVYKTVIIYGQMHTIQSVMDLSTFPQSLEHREQSRLSF